MKKLFTKKEELEIIEICEKHNKNKQIIKYINRELGLLNNDIYPKYTGEIGTIMGQRVIVELRDI